MDLAQRIDAIEPVARRALEIAERLDAQLDDRIAAAVHSAGADQREAIRAQLEDAEKARSAAAAERRERYEAETQRREWWLRVLIAAGPPVYGAAHALISELVHR